MRVLALAGLVVVALGVGLWLLIVRDDDDKVVPDAKAATSKADEAPPPAPSGSAAVQPRSVPNIGAEIQKSIAAKRVKEDHAPPSLPTEGIAGAGSAKQPTEADHMRWAMMKAVHSLEPAILDCLDEAKKSGANLDGASSYGFFYVKNGEEIVFDGSTLEYGPYPEALNTCIQNTGKTMAITTLPPGATRIKVFSKLTVENGEIKNLQMPSFHVLDQN
ncbi:MAG: hypothetical protein AB7T06_09795 [Kofleriaceae bacterium]